MAISEIEKLERRYAENPQGLTFAPLAEIHRKNGDVTRALELLRPGLTLHPDYIPASIVLGRCHLDLGDLASAEAAFTHVLSLDGENVIALKALADITERLARFDEAERWLNALLVVDRSNDEAREQLARVEAAHRLAEITSSAAPAAAVEPASAEAPAEEPEMGAPSGASPTVMETLAMGSVASEAVEDQPPSMGLLPIPEPPMTAPPMSEPPMSESPIPAMMGWMTDAAGVPGTEPSSEMERLDALDEAGPPPEGIELEQPVTLEEPVEPLLGLVGRDEEPPEVGHLEIDEAFHVETAEDIILRSAGGSEFQVANASEELLEVRFQANPVPEPDVASLLEPEVAPLSMESSEPEVSAEAFADIGAEPVAADASPPAEPTTGSEVPVEPEEAEPVDEPAHAEAQALELPASPAPEAPASVAEAAVTAEVAEAGPAAPAAPVWTPPVAEPQAPDLMATQTMAELLLRQGYPTEALRVYRDLRNRNPDDEGVRQKVAELERSVEGEPAPRPAYSARVTNGQSVGDFLRGMLAARLRPAAGAASPAHGEGARSGASADSGGAPTRPAQDSLSLSSVFGDEATPTPPAVPSGGTGAGSGAGGVSYDEFFGAPGSAGPPRSPRTPDAKSDDLDQFHTWLQNLKR